MLPHQREGISFMLERCFSAGGPCGDAFEKVRALSAAYGRPRISSGCVLAHAMGLGKTAQVAVFAFIIVHYTHIAKLAFASSSRDVRGTEAPVRRILVVAPKSTLVAWEEEVTRWWDACKIFVKDYFSAHLSECARQLFPPSSLTNGIQVVRLAGLGSDTDATVRGMRKLEAQEIWSGHRNPLGLFPFFVCNPEGILSLQRMLLQSSDCCVVVDEAHRLQDASGVVVRCLKEIPALCRVLVTGYPIQNNLREYQVMLSLISPSQTPSDELAAALSSMLADERFFASQLEPLLTKDTAGYGEDAIQAALAKLRLLSRCCVHRVGPSVLQRALPPIKLLTCLVALTNLQTDLYMWVLRSNYDAFTAYCLLQQICNHPDVLSATDAASRTQLNNLSDDAVDHASCALIPPFERGVAAFSSKMVVLLEMLRTSIRLFPSEKVLVFSQSVRSLRTIEVFLSQLGAQHCDMADSVSAQLPLAGLRYTMLTGKDTATARDAAFRRFAQDRECMVFLLSVKAGGVGLNLTSACRVILFDACWNPCHDIQAIYRVYRIGQTRPVLVVRLATHGTIEQRVLDSQLRKRLLFSCVVDGAPWKHISSMAATEGLLSPPTSEASARSAKEMSALKSVDNVAVENWLRGLSSSSACSDAIRGWSAQLMESETGESSEEASQSPNTPQERDIQRAVVAEHHRFLLSACRTSGVGGQSMKRHRHSDSAVLRVVRRLDAVSREMEAARRGHATSEPTSDMKEHQSSTVSDAVFDAMLESAFGTGTI